MSDCRACTRPTDLYLCSACTDRLARALMGVSDLVDDLEISLCRMANIGTDIGVRSRDAELPLAFNWNAAEQILALGATLTRHATALAEHHGTLVFLPAPVHTVSPRDPARIVPPRGKVASIALWLAARIDWVANSDQARIILGDIDTAITDARRAVDLPQELTYAGPCGEPLTDTTTPCPGELYAPHKAREVACRVCRAVHDMAARRDWLLSAVEDMLVTAGEASRALPNLLNKPVTTAMIRGYVHRDKLEPVDTARRGVHGRRLPRYRLGDIIDLLREQP